MFQLKVRSYGERKKELIPFATAWMELESIMLSEINQAVRDKYNNQILWEVVLNTFHCLKQDVK